MLDDNVAYTDPPPETISPELTTSVVLRMASCNPLITSSPAVPSTPPTTIVATLDDVETTYKVGEVIIVPVGTKHRVENRQDEDLKFIEVQTGTYFGEDDIVRLEDDYGREGTNG